MLPLLTWLIQGAVGPALVGLPVNWAATDLASAAQRWFRRLRRSDGLSRILQAAAGDLVLSGREFAAVRRLLEQESTWVDVGRGTVEDLAALIASCLPAGEDALLAGRAIARGLLEFTVRDLEPEWFSQVLFARLDRMQAGQATALDQAMLGVHADLAALFAAAEVAEADRFAQVMTQVGRVLDKLPPSPADERQVTVYLVTLINWLNTDPWPQDTRFAGPALTPAAIERKLKVASSRADEKHVLDADDLARRCTRLVVLGGPGAGKTWLARRTARLCAEGALTALATGIPLDEVELPLYTTCARLSAVPSSEPIRRALVSSAFGQLPDLGGARITESLRVMFEERNAPMLLVADSLDEAVSADDRIRQADTLPPAWRIVLTSRPASWNRQFTIGEDDPDRVAGELQPLSYPADVEQFITSWFSGRPEWAEALKSHLRERPALQQAATVPLVLAFYCIVGGDQPLPARRTALHGMVIRRMLTGRWRGSGDRNLDPDACLQILRAWAWGAAATDPVSGVGTWEDDFTTRRITQSQDDQNALDHMAAPLSQPDPDRWMTRRRFVHRSLREHLVAEHIALKMSTDDAARVLLNHLWYDPDWEYAAPAALALHPQRAQVLMQLLCQVSGDDRLPADLAAIDGHWEIRWFLARVALESSEGDWPRSTAEMIGQARLDLATSFPGRIGQLATLAWPASNRQIIELQLARDTDPWTAWWWVDALAALGPTPEERTQLLENLLDYRGPGLAGKVGQLAVTAEERARARVALLRRIHVTDQWQARGLADALAALGPMPKERARAREALLELLTRATYLGAALEFANALAVLGPVPEERARAREVLLDLFTRETGRWRTVGLADAVARLTVTAEERARARVALLALLTRVTHTASARELANALAVLGPVPEERARAREVLLDLFTRETGRWRTVGLADAVARLTVTAEERARARVALLALLTRETDPEVVRELADAVAELGPAPEERARAREALLVLLARGTPGLAGAVGRLTVTAEERARARVALLAQLVRVTNPPMARELADAVAALGAAGEERARARDALLALLIRETRPGMARELAEAVARLGPVMKDRARGLRSLLALLARETHPGRALELAEAVAALNPASEERARSLQSLLALLACESDPARALELADTVAGLGPDSAEQSQAAEALLALLARESDRRMARELANAVSRLAVTAEERARAGEALLALRAHESDDAMVRRLEDAVIRLAVTAEERARAREALLALLALEPLPWTARDLANAVIRLTVTAEERARAREALLVLLTRGALGLAGVVARLAVTAEERAQTTKVLLALLPRVTRPWGARELADAIATLDAAPEERARARAVLLALLARETDSRMAGELADVVARLSPTVADLRSSDNWPFPPTTALLAAARQNSALPEWLAALPLISSTART